MNRLQKRQQAALEKRKRRISTNGQTIAHYRDTATLWARGAVLTGRHIGGALDGEWTFAPRVPAHKLEKAMHDVTKTDLWDEYVKTGWLPNDKDPSHVEAMAQDRDPEATHRLTVAMTDDELLVAAKAYQKTLRECAAELMEFEHE